MNMDIRNIVIIGSGVMGNGIAQISLMSGYHVILVDLEQEFLNKAEITITQNLMKAEKRGQLKENFTATKLLENLYKSCNIAEAVKNADFVIEAVPEDLDLKKSIFTLLDTNAPDHCILASNTSTFSITEIASATNHPERVIGMHFFNPPALMKLIEIIAGKESSENTLDLGEKFGNSLICLKGKRFIARVLKDRPGFIVNRVNAPGLIYLNWIFDKAATENIPWKNLDADAQQIMPMGPCELMDYTGLDSVFHIMNYYEQTLSSDFKPGKIITQMVAEDKLGAKSTQGFFHWENGNRPIIDKSEKAGLFNPEISMAIMLNEGCRLLEEGVVKGYKVIDKAIKTGMNLPGPFGPGKSSFERWSKMLEELVIITQKEYLKPCDLMKSGRFLNMRK